MLSQFLAINWYYCFGYRNNYIRNIVKLLRYTVCTLDPVKKFIRVKIIKWQNPEMDKIQKDRIPEPLKISKGQNEKLHKIPNG